MEVNVGLFDKFKKKNLKNEISIEKIENNISEEEKKS